ncbi:hypothetical protein TSUD_361780 [Trifolium subterraneum]|uniref:ATP-dependent helicase BRM n=1 Tax=Trifolium subterraneum TaxID=3900 RepID=A0A2Z6M202_TRISU|nr:hypothetical protein TSUD_361780 [Trifolium subterraneum]
MQSFQQQLLRKPEGNEAFLAYQAGRQGSFGSNNFSPPNAMQMPQQSQKFMGLGQHGSNQDAQLRGQGSEQQQMLNPVHQAYLQYAFQAAQQKQPALGIHPQQQTKMGMLNTASVKDQEMRMGNLKMQDIMSMQAMNQAQGSSSRSSSEHVSRGEKPMEQGQQIRPIQAPEAQHGNQNVMNSQIAIAAQLQAMQAWARENNIDLSHPTNANLMAKLIPMMQSRMVIQPPKATESNIGAHSSPVPVSKQQVNSPAVASESSAHANSSSDVSGQSGSSKARHTVPPSHLGSTTNPCHSSDMTMQQINVHGRESQAPPRQQVKPGNGTPSMHSQQSSATMNLGAADHPLNAKGSSSGAEPPQMQYIRQSNQSTTQAGGPTKEGGSGNYAKSQAAPAQTPERQSAFTKQQLHVLKAQILAFRRIKKGEGTLPQELLQAITPPPLEMQAKQPNHPAGGQNQVKSAGNIVVEQPRHAEANAKESQSISAVNGHSSVKQESFSRDDKSAPPPVHIQAVMPSISKDSAPTSSAGKEEPKTIGSSLKQKQDSEHGNNITPVRNESALDRGKAIVSQAPVSDTLQITKPAQANSVSQPKDVGPTRKYHGPLFDFPFFTRKHDSFGSSMMVNNSNNLSLAYDVKDLLFEEGAEVLSKKRTENLKKIEGLLSVNLERKRIRPDLVLRLQIEEKKLRLLDVQARLRDEIDQQQQEIMAMPDRPYRKFVRLCERQRVELVRQVQASQRAAREKQLKSIFLWRKKLLEAHWAIRDARTARNRGVGKYHERMLREFSKRKDDDRSKRLEALKNNDVDRYREMLLEQQTSIPGDAAERYAVLSSFLSQTEEYLHKLGSKITAAKNQQEVEEAAKSAADAARLQGLSEEEVRAAAACAGEEVMIRNRFMEMNAPRDSSSVNKYYNLAHAVNEMVIRPPSLLRAGTLRDYQLVGLQWMLSLYNNKLNGILADEMGLGKTVQVSALKFNVLVTTYEFIMYDRAKLSKIDWKYIVIDEAQRMKDRDSVLARDLDRYRCQRRLLLTGTPLQNDLKELWSLLNLLLPEVFDNKKAFHDWFSKPFQKEGPTQNAEDDWLETEKKVITIHRLHQILEPFMLRRRVEDVEGSLPPKDSIVLRCKMSSVQSAIYDWVKSTGTLRLDPEDEERKLQRNPNYPVKQYKTLNNRCMELRKTCNHPLLNYPFFSDLSKEFIVKSCGKLWILDRILIKLQRTGHRVLLFSTMTKLLDILEEYLQWRRLVYRRIDGTTSLEDRESAINDFNSPDSDCFIFLLSIRAAGRGLNLQSADTVVIYDPDPNPKNEEQAVARAHRIGQKRPVKVIYMEAVVDKIPSHQKEDEMRGGGTVDLDDELVGKDRYIGSIEGLIRNNIQQYKIDMADEVINAGRFDQRTTHEERRLTLETLLHDEERYQETVHDVPSLQEVNRMIARSEEEVELFDQMDDELDWIDEMTRYDHIPKWIRANTKEVNAAIAALSKRPLKKALLGGSVGVETSELGSERKRGRPKKHTSYKELEDEDLEYSEASSEERNGYANEEGEIGDFEDDGYSGADGAQPIAKDQMEDGRYEFPPTLEIASNQVVQEAGSSGSGSSAECQKLKQIVSPSISSQKFGSLSALDARPGSVSKRMTDELEEGEIAGSVDSHMEHQQSESWIHDRDEGEDEQVLQKPKIKRKRSLRVRPRHATERPEEKSGSEMTPRLSVLADRKYQAQLRTDLESKSHVDSNASRNDQNSSIKNKRTLPSRRVANASKLHGSPKPTRLNSISAPSEDGGEYSRESWEGKPINSSGSSAHVSRMTEIIQRRCKNVISKLQRRIDKEGQQIVPLLTDLWKRIENSGYSGGSGNSLLDLRKIDQRIDKLEYNGATDLVFDVQLMLKSAMHYYGFSLEFMSVFYCLKFKVAVYVEFPEDPLYHIFYEYAKSALSFTGPISATTNVSSPRQVAVGQSKRHRLINEVDTDPHPPQRPLQRGSGSSGENSRIRVRVPPKESRSGYGSGSSMREQHQEQDDSPPLLTHPGELVVCKKRRNDREKSLAKTRTGPVSPSMRSPGSGSVPKDVRLSQQTQGWVGQPSSQQQNGSVGWANPVKRLRTDSGKRRPSHM